jgi:hypothetical protein
MLIDLNADLTPIKFTADTLTQQRLKQFDSAVRAHYSNVAAPTYSTTFRKGEFEFLDRLRVNLRNLLHTEQDYEYFSTFQMGDVPEVETKLTSTKERRGMVFVSLSTEVKVKNQLRVRCVSSFVLRETGKVG